MRSRRLTQAVRPSAANARAKAELGWRPAYPNWREGLAAVLAAGYAPAIGFLHTGKPLSFVYDIADLWKLDTVVPEAFRVAGLAAKGRLDMHPDRAVRLACRDAFRRTVVASVGPTTSEMLRANGLPAGVAGTVVGGPHGIVMPGAISSVGWITVSDGGGGIGVSAGGGGAGAAAGGPAYPPISDGFGKVSLSVPSSAPSMVSFQMSDGRPEP